MPIDKLPEIIYPVTQVNKVNEIIDSLNRNLNVYYSAINPDLTPSNGVAAWVVEHDLNTENITCSLYEGDNLMISKVSITSANSVTVYINSDTNVDAGTYKVILVANGRFGVAGSGITIDSALNFNSSNPVQNKAVTSEINKKLDKTSIDSSFSSSSTNPVQNKILYPSLSNYLPAGTVISVKLDGTGDFTSLKGAVDYLNSQKWSPSGVTISLGEGTFVLDELVEIHNFSNSIPMITLQGVSQQATIIEGSSSRSDYKLLNVYWNSNVIIQDLTFRRGNSTAIVEAIEVGLGSNVIIQNCTFDGFSDVSINSVNINKTLLRGTLTFKNFTGYGIVSQGGYIASDWITTLNFINEGSSAGTAMAVSFGGQIHIAGENTINLTNILSRTNIGIGTANNTGWITIVS